jgi:hypothetical protein
MSNAMIICSACKCHVRVGEPECAHCGAVLTVRGAARTPDRRRIVVRRVFYATAFAGLGVTGCGGRALNEDVQGTCAPTPASTVGGSIHESTTSIPSSPTLSCAATSASTSCSCGTGGTCTNGQCVSCGCTQDEVCDGTGACQPYVDTWYAGKLPSTGQCYGAPPLLA